MANILCIGAGYVGGPTMAMIAKHCPEHRITVVDVSAKRIEQWNSENLPIYEPGLLEVVQEVRGRNMFFSTEIALGIEEADMIFVSINTPTKTYGEGAGRGTDLQYWEQVARAILSNSKKKNVIVVEKSTLPVRAAAAMARILHSESNGVHFEVISNPEFLAEGTAIKDLTEPDRVLIGGRSNESGHKACKTLADLYAHWVPREKILLANVWSSELSKLFANAMLAQRISSINSITALCEKTGADISEVSHAIGMDKRIGPHFLQASVGFGGSCFRKDILHLAYLCEHYGLPEVAEYWDSVVSMNDYQINRFFKNILTSQFSTLANKKMAILGFAFKPDTGDTRDTPALPICRKLLEERASISISDPQALDNARFELEGVEGEIHYEQDPYLACQGAHSLLLITHWQEFRQLDYQRIFDSMAKPAFIFDGRNFLDHQHLFEIGFNVFPLGKPALSHLQ
ncbi:MAG: nucleotide sugar dehydrogenase [SAR324 cluster bacterium]|nr:nucleotide sugar dehydrogenase [SAR324 cluster bacterium]